MSELARDYYQERAERLDIDMPLLLTGRPWQLLGPEEGRISLQQPDPDKLQLVTQRYDEALDTVTDFVREGSLRTQELVMRKSPHGIRLANERHIESMVEKILFPDRLYAGRIKDLRIEAIAREEVQQSMLRRLVKSQPSLAEKNYEDSQVYILTSAELYAGRTLGRTACLTLVHFDRNAESVHYRGMGFAHNDLIAQSGLDQSRAIEAYIRHWGLAKPAVQAVRRGKNQHGRARSSY